MSYLNESITPATMPTTAQVIKYKANNSTMINPLNKISIAQQRGSK